MARGLRFASILSALFRPILRILGMEPSNHREFITGDINLWYHTILSLCLLERTSRDYYKDPEAFPVRKIRRYKEVSASQHEYLVAEIVPKGCLPKYVRIERLRSSGSTDKNRSPPSDSQSNFARQSLTSSVASINSTSLASDSSLKDGPALDQVRLLRGWPPVEKTVLLAQKLTDAGDPKQGRDDKLPKLSKMVEQVTFRHTTLYDLAIIAYTLHNAKPVYQIAMYQCYWFASVILRVLESCDGISGQTSAEVEVKSKDGASEEEERSGNTDLGQTQVDMAVGGETSEQEEEPCCGKGGSWYGMQVHVADKKTVEYWGKEYKKQRDAFQSTIDNHMTEEQKTEEAQARAEAEAKRAEVEAKRAEAEAKRAEVEAKRAEVEAKRAEAEERRADMAEGLRNADQEEIRQLKERIAKMERDIATTA